LRCCPSIILRQGLKILDKANFQWFLFFKTGSFNRKANIKHLNCPLSERFKSTIQYHVALDFGMECFLVSDRGDLFGRKFYSKVREYAEKIDSIQREMQRRGKKPTESKRYLRLQHRLSEYVKNEEFMVRLFDERFRGLWSKGKSVPKPEAWVNAHERDICPC